MINKRCTENQTRSIIRVAATSTDIRKQKIMALLEKITHNESPVIRGFGLSIDTEFAKVPARLLSNFPSLFAFFPPKFLLKNVLLFWKFHI